MKLKFLFLLCFMAVIKLTAQTNLQCNFNMNSYATVGSVYRCEVTNNLNITSPDNAVIESVSGTHMSGKTNDDVMAFHAVNKAIEHFPSGLEKFFKNLKVFDMSYNKIKQVSQSDLKPFPGLVYLEVYGNDVEILEDGLFDNHPNMQVVWFNVNKIFHVGKNVFNSMKNITYLGFGTNPCINMYIRDDATKAKEIIEILKSKCFDTTFANFLQNLVNLETDTKTLSFKSFEAFSKKLENLAKEFESSKFSNSTTIERRLQKLQDLRELKFCYAHNLPNFESLLTNLMSRTENNLKSSLTGTCSAIDVKLSSLNDKIFQFDQNILKIDEKITNTDKKCSNFPQITEKFVSLETKLINQESALLSSNQEIVNLGKELTKLTTNHKEARNDISKLDENISTMLETSSTEAAIIERSFSALEEKFSNFEEKFEEKILGLEKKLDKIFKLLRV